MLLLLLLPQHGLLASAQAAGKPSRDRERTRAQSRREKSKSEREREPQGPPSLALQSLDFDVAKAVVRVGGAGKAPDARLFVFHDDQERHFVALFAACEEAVARLHDGAKVADGSAPSTATPTPSGSKDSGDGALVCELDVPRPYLRAHVVGLSVRLRGRDVAADEHVVAEQWARAQAAMALPSTPPAVPMTSVQVPCDDPGFEWPPRRDKTPNATDEEEVQETEEDAVD